MTTELHLGFRVTGMEPVTCACKADDFELRHVAIECADILVKNGWQGVCTWRVSRTADSDKEILTPLERSECNDEVS